MNIEIAYKIEEMKKAGASDREIGRALGISERAEAVRIAEKELARAARSLAGAKKRGAPAQDVENLEKKVQYKTLVLEMIRLG